MTPKEKAKELVGWFIPFVDEGWYELALQCDIKAKKVSNAKHCALISVNEILGEIYTNQIAITDKRRKFWQDVKSEIENL